MKWRIFSACYSPLLECTMTLLQIESRMLYTVFQVDECGWHYSRFRVESVYCFALNDVSLSIIQ